MIEDTCACGSTFAVARGSAVSERFAHGDWLKAHERCRGVARGELRFDLPAGHPNSVHPRAEDQPVLPGCKPTEGTQDADL